MTIQIHIQLYKYTHRGLRIYIEPPSLVMITFHIYESDTVLHLKTVLNVRHGIP